ncbi:STAS domain-containing protein [Noviherbaspirillum soli]|uniref:STAS domain-containing protein n=1 Tax=Noviherbaspirillum soli TaxID=1064518 RepID=UPI00188C3713|nr:STAS domain-containing protein [Noviherbaspirillum soli]
MTTYSEISNDVLLMRPHQAVDHAAALDIQERINILSDTRIDALVLDLSQAAHACSSLLEVILDLVNRPAPIQVMVIGASQQFQSLMQLCGVHALVSEYPTVEKAQDALKRSRYSESEQRLEFDDDNALNESASLPDDDDDEDWHASDDDD